MHESGDTLAFYKKQHLSFQIPAEPDSFLTELIKKGQDDNKVMSVSQHLGGRVSYFVLYEVAKIFASRNLSCSRHKIVVIDKEKPM